MRDMNRKRGFTLIELMVTLAVAAILLTVGVPAFQEMLRNNRAATHANEFLTALNFTRSEAIKRGRNISLCPSSNQTACGGANWAVGWIAFVDADNDGVVDAGEELLRAWGALSGNPSFTGPTILVYRPAGELAAGTAQLDYALGTHDHCVQINSVGRPRIEKDTAQCP